MSGNHNSGRKPSRKKLLEAARVWQVAEETQPTADRCGCEPVGLAVPDDLPAGVKPIFAELVRLYRDVVSAEDVHTLSSWAMAIWIEREAAKALIGEGLLRQDEAHAGRLAKNPAFTIWKAAAERTAALASRFGGDPSARVRLHNDRGEAPIDPRALLMGGE